VYGYDQRAEVFGSLGCLIADNDSDTRVALLAATGIQTDNPPYFFLQRYFQAYVDEMKSFVEAVLEDREPACSFL
jgi:myo-inositol 2-dehydrogenase/D-chiro-inositol 1-dehydrogenase